MKPDLINDYEKLFDLALVFFFCCAGVALLLVSFRIFFVGFH